MIRISRISYVKKESRGEKKMWLKMGRFRGLEDGPERDERDEKKGVRTEAGRKWRNQTDG